MHAHSAFPELIWIKNMFLKNGEKNGALSLVPGDVSIENNRWRHHLPPKTRHPTFTISGHTHLSYRFS